MPRSAHCFFSDPGEHERPDAGHVHRLHHQVHHRPAQPHQQQAGQQGGGEEGGRRRWRQEGGGGKERGEEGGGEEGGKGEGVNWQTAEREREEGSSLFCKVFRWRHTSRCLVLCQEARTGHLRDFFNIQSVVFYQETAGAQPSSGGRR